MAFRKYGGINFAATNNIVRNHYSNSDHFTSSSQMGLNSNMITSGTVSNSNFVFSSNIDMCGNSIFNTYMVSPNMAGIYLITSEQFFYPIYSSISDYSNYYTNTASLPSSSNQGATGTYQNISMNLSNMDYAYLITPQYGLQVYDGSNMSGTLLLDVYNNTFSSVIVSPVTAENGESCIVTNFTS